MHFHPEKGGKEQLMIQYINTQIKGKKMEKTIWNIRTLIYVSAIATLLIANVCQCNRVHAIEYNCDTGECMDDDTDSNDFWPPDMIPHPDLPGTGPSGPPEPVYV